MADDEISRDELIQLLSNPQMLRLYGYQMTPKGCMALILMTELELDDAEAERIAQKIEDLIFINQYIYVHEDHLELKDPGE